MTFSLSASQIQNFMAASIEFHMRGEVAKQSIQDKHLLKMLEAGSKPFPGGKDKKITYRVKGDYVGAEEGYEGDDQVSYYNPSEIREASIIWYERHIGLTCTGTELKMAGITVTESDVKYTMKDQKQAAATRLANIWDDKMEDMTESRSRSRERMFWADGSASTKDVPGVKYWIVDNPTVPLVVAGLDQGANTWWRNRARLGIVANLANAASQVLVDTLQFEYRQLTRYGDKPTTLLCGSAFIEQLERELRARGQYTQTGWSGTGTLDVSMGDVNFKGMRAQYEPHLDDIGESKRGYWLNIGANGLCQMHMDGELDKSHAPARDPKEYVIYMARTSTLAMKCRRRNHMGVYSIA